MTTKTAGGSVTRKRRLKTSYAGFVTGAGKYLIEDLTETATAETQKRMPERTGATKASVNGDVRGLTGMVKAGGPGARQIVFIEFGTVNMRPIAPLRLGVLAARRKVRKAWPEATQKAARDGSRRG